MSDKTRGDVGYKKPPVSTRFRKGQSGNPKGRPRGKRKDVPHEAVLGQMVTIREDGTDRRVTAAEAILLQLAKEGLEGDGGAARDVLASIEHARARHARAGGTVQLNRRTIYESRGSVNAALEPLRMARKLDRKRPTARMKLEPWIVEAALARLERPLDPEAQRIVLAATRTPGKVNWPSWWGVETA